MTFGLCFKIRTVQSALNKSFLAPPTKPETFPKHNYKNNFLSRGSEGELGEQFRSWLRESERSGGPLVSADYKLPGADGHRYHSEHLERLATDNLPCQRDRRRYLTHRASPASSAEQRTPSTSTPTTRGGVETAVQGAKLSESSRSKSPGAPQGGGRGVADSGARRGVHGAATALARSTAHLPAWERASPPPGELRRRREPASGTHGRRGRSPARLGHSARPPRPWLPERTAVPRRPPPAARRPPPAARRFHTNPGGRRGGGGEDGCGTCPHPGQRQRGAPPNSRLGSPARVCPQGACAWGEGKGASRERAGREGGLGARAPGACPPAGMAHAEGRQTARARGWVNAKRRSGAGRGRAGQGRGRERTPGWATGGARPWL